MGYFEGLTNACFKKNKNGNTVFFPWGVLAGGRVLHDEATEARVRAFVSRYYKMSLSIIIGVGVIAGWAWALLFGPVLGAWFYFGSKSLILGCPCAEEKLTLKESYANSATSHSKLTLWLLLICSILFVVAGIFVASTAKSSDQMVMGWFSVVFFSACGAAIGYMLKLKRA